MKVYELFEGTLDPVAAAKEMEDLNTALVHATGEYRALRTPAALKKITDLNDKIQKILRARGKLYGSIYEEELLEGVPLTAYKAREKIRELAMKLHVVSSELMSRYKKRLERFANNAARALSQLELDMNLSRGTLKGFDALYQTATSV